MTSRRALLVFLLAVAVALGCALRWTTRDELRAGDRVHALTSDDNYHLRRARFAAVHFPRTILFDPMMNFPFGGVPIWPPLFDLALAAPARLLPGAGATAGQIERGAAAVPLVLAAGSIALAGLLGLEIFGVWGAGALALFVAVCPGHILWTQYGHTDQHVAESFCGLLVLWLFVASRTRADPARAATPQGASAAWWEASAGVALALATLTWQGAIYWGAVFALALFLEALIGGRSVFRATVLVLGLSSALVAAATALWLGDFRPPLTYISFGFFQPLFLAALTGGTALLDTLLAAARGQLTLRAASLRLLLVLAAAAVVLGNAAGLLAGLGRGLGYVLGQTSGEVASATGYVSYPKNWLKGIFEARPLFAEGPGLAMRELSLAFFLTPLALLLWLRRAWLSQRAGLHLALAVWGGVTLALAVAQRMDVYYAAPLAGAVLVEACRAAAVRARIPRMEALAAAAVGVILAAPFAGSTPTQLHAVHPAGSDLYATLDWMRRELPHVIDPYDPRLLSPASAPKELSRAGSVIGPWSLGHLVLYEAGLPVVANNFGYGFTDSLKFFLSETEEEALAIAHRRRARWVLTTDLVPRMNDYASYIERPASLDVTPRGLVPTDRYFRTLQSRLYDFDGAGARLPQQVVPPLEHFRLRFHSASAIRRGERWLARWKVFEITD
jgi:asparagine N-glycosylation enzyme membrane subunit Stt3